MRNPISRFAMRVDKNRLTYRHSRRVIAWQQKLLIACGLSLTISSAASTLPTDDCCDSLTLAKILVNEPWSKIQKRLEDSGIRFHEEAGYRFITISADTQDGSIEIRKRVHTNHSQDESPEIEQAVYDFRSDRCVPIEKLRTPGWEKHVVALSPEAIGEPFYGYSQKLEKLEKKVVYLRNPVEPKCISRIVVSSSRVRWNSYPIR